MGKSRHVFVSHKHMQVKVNIGWVSSFNLYLLFCEEKKKLSWNLKLTDFVRQAANKIQVCLPTAGVIRANTTMPLYMGSENSNSGSHTYAAGTEASLSSLYC